MQKYFIRPKYRKDSCYYEFYKGKWNGEFWHDESICIHDIYFDGSDFEHIIQEIIPQYDPWGETVVSRENWDLIKEIALQHGGKSAAIVKEAEKWMCENFSEHEIFTILGL